MKKRTTSCRRTVGSVPGNYQKPEDLIGTNGILKQLTKKRVVRALDAELARLLGCDKQQPVCNLMGNTRDGLSRKKLKGEFGARSSWCRAPPHAALQVGVEAPDEVHRRADVKPARTCQRQQRATERALEPDGDLTGVLEYEDHPVECVLEGCSVPGDLHVADEFAQQ
jgi:hypothetical protein